MSERSSVGHRTDNVITGRYDFSPNAEHLLCGPSHPRQVSADRSVAEWLGLAHSLLAYSPMPTPLGPSPSAWRYSRSNGVIWLNVSVTDHMKWPSPCPPLK